MSKDWDGVMDECAILAFGMIGATAEEIALLRKDPGPGRPKALEFQILKHADEHTVLALAAMLRALTAFPADFPFGEWGVVAAPRFPGRTGTNNALERFRADGARGVSPLAIPNVCLHSLSGTVSLVFAMRGPNFGVGGGLANVADGLVTGLSVQLEQQPPGTWVILSEWDREPGQVGTQGRPPRACALALALAPTASAPTARRLGFRRAAATPPARPACPRLTELTDYLVAAPPGSSWSCTLDWGMELVLTEGGSKA